jgi:ketosteroid isomerase-like protein
LSDNASVLRECFAAISAGDVERLLERYTDDCVLEFPYRTREGDFAVRGREQVRAYLARALANVSFELVLTALHPAADPDLLVAEYRAEGRLRANGRPYRNRYVGFWWFRDARVRRTREYYDPIAAAEALAALPDDGAPG